MKPKLGSGQRFTALKQKIAARGNVSNPGAVAASIGRAKYGNSRFQKMAAAGRRHPNPDPSVFTPGTIENLAHPTMRDVKEVAPNAKPDGDSEHFTSEFNQTIQEADPFTHQANTQLYGRSGMPTDRGEIEQHPVQEEQERTEEGQESEPSSVVGVEPFTPSGRHIMDSDILEAGGESSYKNPSGEKYE